MEQMIEKDDISIANEDELKEISLFLQDTDDETLKYNAPFQSMDIGTFNSHPEHPCMLIKTNGKRRIALYWNDKNLYQYEHYIASDISLDAAIRVLPIRRDKMIYGKAIDQYIVGNLPEFAKHKDWHGSTLNHLLTNTKLGTLLYVIMEDSIFYRPLHMLINYTPKRKEYKGKDQDRESYSYGGKITPCILVAEAVWNSMEFKEKCFCFQFSYAFCQRIYALGKISIGNASYYSKYAVQRQSYGIFDYLYIDYNPAKCLRSVQEYYDKFGYNGVQRQQQRYRCPLYNEQDIYRPFLAHKLWLGLRQCYNVITAKQKAMIIQHIEQWLIKSPKGIKEDSAMNRKKWYIYYHYVYNEGSSMNTTELVQATAEDAGLIKIKKRKCPKWVTEIEHHLKKIGVIPLTEEIQQIGINCYYNEHDRDLTWGEIQSHREHDKF